MPAAFALNCTPVVNLFEQAAEPIAVDHTVSEYDVVPDARRPGALEIYSLESVTASDSDGNRRRLLPAYGTGHAAHAAGSGTGEPVWWLPHRRSDGHEGAEGDKAGTRTTLSLLDPQFTPSAPPDTVLSVETLCFNGSLPELLPFGGGRPGLRPVDPLPAVATMRLITAPTASLRPDHARSGRWRLISHLSLNHLSLVSDGGLDALKEMLLLYDIRDSAETRLLIDGVVGLASKPGTARLRSAGQTAFCRGIDVAITFDEASFTGNGIYLAASVLEHFLGMYAGVNSFARLTARVKGQGGILKTWPARAGDRILL
jgi:type VI secretion system protein ImpG